MQNEMTLHSGESKIDHGSNPVASVADRQALTPKPAPIPPPVPVATHDPLIHPKVVAKWTGQQWTFTFDDKDGKIEVTPIQKNRLLSSLKLFLSRRFRANRVRAHGESIEAALRR